MTPLPELANLLLKAFPAVEVNFSEPYAPGYVGFLDVVFNDNWLTVIWQEEKHFGLSSPQGHGYGEGADELYRTVEEIAARMIHLLKTGEKTAPPIEVQLRELRAERKIPQTQLTDLLGVSQPAVSRLEHRRDRMFISTLKSVVEAMGGSLVIQARFPDGFVREIATGGTDGRIELNAVEV